jgi:hypothetical protein
MTQITCHNIIKKYFIYIKGLKYAFIMSNVIIELKYLQSGDRGIKVQ